MDTETTETTQTEEQAPVETKSSQELQAAEAALAVMPDDGEVGDETSPANESIKAEATKLLGDITARRAVVRALKQQEENLLTPKIAEAAKAPVKSPFDVYAEDHPGDQVPIEVHQAQSKFEEAKQATKEQAKAKADETASLTGKAQAVLKRGEEKFSDFKEVHEAAGDLLTKGDWLDIRDAEFPEEELYERSIGRILRAGNRAGATAETKAAAKTLATRLRAKKVATESVKKNAPKEDGSETATSTKVHRTAHMARIHDVLG